MSTMIDSIQPVLKARGLMKRYGTVVAMNGADLDLFPDEVLGVIGDNRRRQDYAHSRYFGCNCS